jgi:hypothetical protein
MDVSQAQENWINTFYSQDHLGIKYPISPFPQAIKIMASTLGVDSVAVQPLSAPSGTLFYADLFKIRVDHLGIAIDQ